MKKISHIPGKISTKNLQRVDYPNLVFIIAAIMDNEEDRENIIDELYPTAKAQLAAVTEAEAWIKKFMC